MARQKLKEIVIDREDKAEVVRPEDCICCKLCELRCPDLAVEVQISKEGENE